MFSSNLQYNTGDYKFFDFSSGACAPDNFDDHNLCKRYEWKFTLPAITDNNKNKADAYGVHKYTSYMCSSRMIVHKCNCSWL